MATLDTYQKQEPIKLLFIGDSGTGKTGALTSLVCAGYKLRVLDFDSGLASLASFTRAKCPASLANVSYHTFRDEYVLRGNTYRVRKAEAMHKALAKLDKWSDAENDNPSAWGLDTILVIDSLTHLARAAFNWAESLNPTAKDRRQIYGAAQELIEQLIANITGDNVKCHVIVISHIDYIELDEGTTKGFARTIGKALSPKVPTYFNYQLLAQTSGSGANVKRSIRTVPTASIDAKAPVAVEPTLPLETGLADFFTKVQTTE